MASTAAAIAGNSRLTASATVASSSFINWTIWSGVIWSIAALALLVCSVGSALSGFPPLSSPVAISWNSFAAHVNLWYSAKQLLALQVGVKHVFVAAVDRAGILNRLVALGVTGAAGVEH